MLFDSIFRNSKIYVVIKRGIEIIGWGNWFSFWDRSRNL